MSRDINQCVPELVEKWRAFDAKMHEAKLDYIITRTACDLAEQMALYVQGRADIGLVNLLRKAVSWAPLAVDVKVHPVTWTLRSKHVVAAGELAKAFDIALVKDGQPHWEEKHDVNKNEKKDYREAGIIGESVGLKWGGRFKDSAGRPKPDACHFELL